jgi:DNA-binding SARP family transcriptional activator
LANLALYLLGAPRLEKDGKPVEFDTRKAMALLAYLAVTGQSHGRDALAALFWADYDQTRARAALRRTLSVLHKALGGDALEITRESIGLLPNGPVWSDVAEFHRLLGEPAAHVHTQQDICPRCLESLGEAARLYRADFLAGFTLRDSPEFDDWQFFQTETLRRELAGILERLTLGFAARGDYESAIAHARRRLALDPLDEPAHRQLMQLYAASGQHAAALRQYRECARLLDEELGVLPMDETVRLYQDIKEQRSLGSAASEPRQLAQTLAPTPPARSPGPLPLVGRGQELAAMQKLYNGMRAGGNFLVLEGEAGIGKTRLADEFVSWVRLRGASVISARCYSGESYLAYAPFIDGLRGGLYAAPSDWHQSLQPHWIVDAARLLPELGRLRADLPPAAPLNSPGAQTRFFEGVCQVLLALCAGASPGVLLFDDLEWADEASLDLLTYLVRRLHGRRLFVLAVWRSEDLASVHRLRRLLAETQRDGYGSAVQLARLDPASVHELAGTVAAGLGLALETLAHRLYQETEGLPFFISEYLAALPQAAGSLESDWSMPQGVRDILRSRLEAVDETGLQLLQTAAVIGRSFDFDTLLSASGRSEDETAATLETLVARGLIRDVEPARGAAADEPVHRLIYDFSHEKMRLLVYAETSQGRRRLLHQRVAEGLLRHAHGRRGLRRVAAQAAYHFRQGGRLEEAAEYSKLAGEHARALFANAEALTHFQIALALGHPNFLELEEAIGDLFTLLGNYTQALTSYQTALQHLQASVQDIGRLHHKMGDVYHRQGEWDLAENSFQAAVQSMEAGIAGFDSFASLSRLYADWSRTARRRDQPERALDMAAQALELAEKAGDAQALAQAHNILGMLQRSQGDLDGAITHLEQSLAIAENLPEPGIRIAALNNLSLAYADHAELDRALTYAHSALELCVLQGDRHREAALHSNLADLYHSSGDEAQSMSHLKQAVVIFSEIGAGQADRPRPEIWKLTDW